LDTFKKYIYVTLIFAVIFIANLFLGRTQDKTGKNSCIESGCHEMVTRGWFKHTPVKEDCSTCHNYLKGNHPNDNGREYELAAKIPDLCVNCHDLNKGDKSKHAPVKAGECLSCHDPHSSDLRNLIISDGSKPLCLKCHDVKGKDTLIHNPVKKNECSTCHEPHNSKFSKLLRNDEDKVCLNCHNKQIKGVKTTIADINLKLNAKTVHEPAASGCVSCHKPHASNNKSLLASDYSTESYVFNKSKIGSLCFTCHSIEILLQNKPESTEFKNGNVNLHFLHVNRDKSRNCTICHDMHGTEGPHLVKDLSSFGEWSLPINYKTTESGGSCAPGCHEEISYVNKVVAAKSTEPIDNSKAKPTQGSKTKPQSNLTTTLKGQLKVDEKVDKSLIQGLGLLLVNSDSTIDETLLLDNELRFERPNLPYGSYDLSLNADDIVELKAKPDKYTINIDLKDSSSVTIAHNISFSLKFDEEPTKKIEQVAKTENIRLNQTRTFNYKNEQTAMQTKGLNNFLNAASEFLRTNTKARISLVVHTDNAGTTKELQRISNNIGKNVENYLIKLKINRKRIFTQGKGSLVPVQPSTTEKGRAANRRIEIRIF